MREIPLGAIEDAARAIYDPVVRTPLVRLDIPASHADRLAGSEIFLKLETLCAPGAFFVLPGGPGHAVLVLDLAVDHQGHRIALLGQGYMPAQDFQVLASQEVAISPWFSLDGEHLTIAFWPAPFPWSSLHRFSAG